ncbi:uncharacterized protein LOC110853102 [Folsomia candida]|uniref:uncharacterized protein LOC110853102 n=1 Tax=Folsomia candida TaxID=158441 RepID=UPI000B9065E4|nr:uncharacterized protein LOC110853102 [Folsomia candida]
MGITKGTAICPMDDNTIFVIRKHGPDRPVFTPNSKASSISRQASVNSYQSKTSRLTLDEDLEALRSANIVFIRHHVQREPDQKKLLSSATSSSSQLQNKYTIVNTCGETLFYAVEITPDVSPPSPPPPPRHKLSLPSCSFHRVSESGSEKQLKFAVVNSQGEEVFDIQGHPGVRGYGAYTVVRRDSTILGNVAQTNKIASCHRRRRDPPSYLIESPDGKTLQKILRQSSWRNLAKGFLPVNDFNVSSPDGTICRAKISRQTNAITLEEYSQTDTYALSFHTTDMDGKLKSLLIAAVLMLDYQLTEKTTEWRDYKSLIFRILFCAFLIFILIALILVVVDGAVEFQKEKVKRFPGQVPPP